MSKKYFIVWNATRSEGFITDDEDDAHYTSTGISNSFGITTVGEAFRESYADDEDGEELEVQEVELPNN